MKPKDRRVTQEEYEMLQAYKAKAAEEKQVNFKILRERKIKENEVAIKGHERDIAFKQAQIDKGEKLEKHPEYAGDLKPKHVMENEIDLKNFEIDKLKEEISSIKKIMKEEENG